MSPLATTPPTVAPPFVPPSPTSVAPPSVPPSPQQQPDPRAQHREHQDDPDAQADGPRHDSAFPVRLAAVVAVVMAIGLGILQVVGYALASKQLTIRRIAVSGNTRMSSGDVRTLLGDLIGTNVLAADLEASRLRLLASPWVKDAEVRRVFPASIAVAVAERRVAAVGRLGADLLLGP